MIFPAHARGNARRVYGRDNCAGTQSLDVARRHQEQRITGKADNFCFGVAAIVLRDAADGADRQTQAGCFEHQPRCTCQPSLGNQRTRCDNKTPAVSEVTVELL
jgi:hypothetical protein